MQIIPTTGLKKDINEAERRIESLIASSRWIQIDVGDGFFKPGKTFELELINRLNFATENLLWDVHLMVKDPINWVEKCINIGASRIIGQVEMMADRGKFLEKVKNEGIEAGLAFDIGTPVKGIEGDWDEILLMGRPAGFGVYPLDDRIYEKISQIKKMGYTAGVDGGANKENIKKLEEAGADVVYSESEYFELVNAN